MEFCGQALILNPPHSTLYVISPQEKNKINNSHRYPPTITDKKVEQVSHGKHQSSIADRGHVAAKVLYIPHRTTCSPLPWSCITVPARTPAPWLVPPEACRNSLLAPTALAAKSHVYTQPAWRNVDDIREEQRAQYAFVSNQSTLRLVVAGRVGCDMLACTTMLYLVCRIARARIVCVVPHQGSTKQQVINGAILLSAVEKPKQLPIPGQPKRGQNAFKHRCS